jgi:hypothetical protein
LSVSGCGGVSHGDQAGGSGGETDGQGGAAGQGAADACPAKDETTIGPYPNLGPLERKDVRGNTTGITTPKDGAALTLRVQRHRCLLR